MKKTVALLLVFATVASLGVLFGACGSDGGTKDGFYFDAIEDESGAVIAYRVSGCSKKTLKQDKIVIPDSFNGKPVTVLGGSFSGALASELVVPEGVVKMQAGFSDCPNLTTVSLPDSLDVMFPNVFRGSPNVGNVENGFRYVDGWVVERVESEAYLLRDDTEGVADGVSLVGIADADGNIRFPEGMRYVGDVALEGAVITGDVTFPSTLKRMGYTVLKNARVDGTVTLSQGSPVLYSDVLYKSEIGRVVINCFDLYFEPSGVVNTIFPNCKIGELVLNGGSITTHSDVKDDGVHTATVHKAIASAENLPYLFATPKVLEVTGGHILPHACKQMNIEELILDEKVYTVGQGAFAGCLALKSLTVKSPTLTLGAQVFYQTAIESIAAPASVLAALPAASCTALTVTSGTLTAKSLAGMGALASLVLWDAVTAVATGALSGLSALKTAAVPAKYVGALPKEKLEKLTVTGGTSLDGAALSSATSLTEIILPSQLTAIGENAFADAVSLRAVRYGGTVADWARIEFASATANPLCFAKSLYIDNSVVIEALNLIAVGNYAFAGYAALAQVTFGEGLARVGVSAFLHCTGLTTLTLPASLSEIGEGAFSGCSGITEAHFADATGWYRFESATVSSGTAMDYDVSNAARAATALTQTYTDYTIKKVG